MRLGIDFGTSRIVVAVADRGNYPVVSFEAAEDQEVEWIPPVIGVHGDEMAYGWEAWRQYGKPGWSHLRSIKSVLARAGPLSLVQFASTALTVQELLTGLAQQVRVELCRHSNVRPAADEPLEAVLGVPALANSNQRYLTVEAFTRAGFHVRALVNEPSAAAVEFGHRKAGVPEPESVLVYDFGGGTFDVSLVRREENAFQVLASESLPSLGGDDFDDVLAELALRQAGRLEERHGLSQEQEFLLIEECRQKKEAIHPNSRKITLELDAVGAAWGEAAVPVAEYYEACLPMVEETLALTEQVLEKCGSQAKPPVLYLTGGASELPLVGRMVRERFGRRVHRSAYMRSATAIGLAIHAEGALAAPLQERFTRHFGLWREAEGGDRIVFDPLILRGAALPQPGAPPIRFGCGYSPAHNIGHYRFLECTALDEAGAPTGDLTPWDEIRFPFDPRLAGLADLSGIPVERHEINAGQRIEEEYEVSSSGTVTVRLRNVTAAYQREYALGRWAAKKAPAATARRRHRARPGG
ncbi:MAG: Hsp70 family protein [Bryobacteraceae bacterium]